jgi:hypothetical protein
MDFNPIATPVRLAIRENYIHAALYRSFESILLDA